MFVYKATNLTNGKVYVGQTVLTVKARWSKHVSCAKSGKTNMLIYAAIRKYGPSSFEVETIGSYASKEELSKAEIDAIALHKASDHQFGYNLLQGGEGAPKGNKYRLGKTHSDSSKEKMRVGHAGSKHTTSQATKDKISLSEKGKIVSEETRQRLRTARLGKEPWNKGLSLKAGTLALSDDARAQLAKRAKEYSNLRPHPIGWKPKSIDNYKAYALRRPRTENGRFA